MPGSTTQSGVGLLANPQCLQECNGCQSTHYNGQSPLSDRRQQLPIHSVWLLSLQFSELAMALVYPESDNQTIRQFTINRRSDTLHHGMRTAPRCFHNWIWQIVSLSLARESSSVRPILLKYGLFCCWDNIKGQVRVKEYIHIFHYILITDIFWNGPTHRHLDKRP